MILVPHSENSLYVSTCTATTVKLQTVSVKRNERGRGLNIFVCF